MTEQASSRAGAFWINAATLSTVANISQQAANAALRKSKAEKLWRGHQLIVRTVHGKGGNGGKRYEVLVSSLPPVLRDACREISIDVAPPASPEIDHAPDITRARFQVIESALACPSGSNERGREIARLSTLEWEWPDGDRRRCSERTIRNWVAAYERDGFAGLKTQRRADKGKRRTLISREWDRAVDLNDDIKARIETSLRIKVRKFWQSRYAFAGANRIAELATNELIGITEQAGCTLAYSRLRIVCRVPINFVNQEREHKKVAVNKFDHRKEFDAKPRISRDIRDLRPMQMIMADVHPIDVLYRRSDGSTATPKAITWLDVATNRIHADLVFLEKGEGVSQEHVIESFMAMVLDDAWGMPASLYLDNGSEYNWPSLIDDAMQLSCPVYLADDKDDWTSRSAIVRAQPYNAPAKGQIEGFFGNFEKRYLSALPGWIGGDRMNQKTANVGRVATPYPGTPAEFGEEFQKLLRAYNEKPQDHGKLRGLSPNGALRRAIETGHERVSVPFETLVGVFCKRTSRKVVQGTISFRKERYYHDALIPLIGERVEVRIPMIRDKTRLLVYREGEFLCTATPDQQFPYGGSAGPRETARRQKIRRDYFSNLKVEGPELDHREIINRELSYLPASPTVEIGARLELSEDIEAAGRAMLEPPKDPETEAEKEERQRDEIARNREIYANRIRATGGNR